MPKFTFICEHENYINGKVESKTTLEFNKESLFDVIQEFETFLKGCGYCFDGQLDIVKDELEDDYSDRIPDINLDEVNKNFEINLENSQYDLDFGAAQPTLNFDLDEFKIEGDASSATWPFPANERPN